MRARQSTSCLVAALVLATMSGALNSPAQANNRGGCSITTTVACNRDDDDHRVSYDLTTKARAAVEYTRTASYETTDLVTSLRVHDNADDAFFGMNYTWGRDNTSGDTTCLYPFSGRPGVCNHAHATFNGAYDADNTTDQYRKIACHEFGHTVGLRHPDQTNPLDDYRPDDTAQYNCMVQGLGYGVPLPAGLQGVGTHNAGHIDAQY